MTHDDLAQIVHEANRAYCKTLGDHSQPPWNRAPKWQRDSALAGIRGILSGAITSPRESHASWLAQKAADGWRYGEVKNPATKEHPCFVPYESLPARQQAKDAIFFGIVRACAPHVA